MINIHKWLCRKFTGICAVVLICFSSCQFVITEVVTAIIIFSPYQNATHHV